MNELKRIGNELGALLESVDTLPESDHRMLAIGRTQIQLGLMAAIRAIARPTTFC
jgi:hypothetical protein